MSVFCGLIFYRIDRNLENIRNLLRHKWDVGALVALAPMGYGSQIGRIRFQHDIFQAHLGQQFLKFAVFEGDDAAHADGESSFDSPFGLLDAAGEAVQHGFQLAGFETLQDADGLRVGTADVQ